MTFAVLLAALALGWTTIEAGRFLAARSRLEHGREDAALDAATGLLARRHGMVRLRVELRRAKRAGRTIIVQELVGPDPVVLDAIGSQLAPTVTYPNVALRVAPLEIMLLQSRSADDRPSSPRQVEERPLGCTVATRVVAAGDADGFAQLERLVDEIEAGEVEA